MSFVTFSKTHFSQRRAIKHPNDSERRFPYTKVVLSVLREVPSLPGVLPQNTITCRKSWKTKHTFEIPELRLLYKHLRLSKLFGETNGFTISQTRKFLQKLYIPGLYGRRFLGRRSDNLDLNSGGPARTQMNRGIVKSDGYLSHPSSSEFAFGLFGQLNPVASRSRSASLSQRRPSLSLQLQLPFHSLVNTSLCQSEDPGYEPFTPHSQILRTPPCPPQIPRYAKRATPKDSISPSWSTNTCLPPIFEASVANMNCRMSPVAPPEAIKMHAPRRLSYSRTSGRKNSLTTSNCTDQTILSGEKLLASPVTIKSSSYVPRSPVETFPRKDSFFHFQHSPTALKV